MLCMFKNTAKIAKIRASQFFTKENGEVNIIAIVVLIGIAVILAIVFKDAIWELLNKLFGNIFETADNINETLAPVTPP